jgi:hypothetical protein
MKLLVGKISIAPVGTIGKHLSHHHCHKLMLMWCSVVMNFMFNTLKPLPIISERTVKNNEAGRLFFPNYLEGIIQKLSLQGRFFFKITNNGRFQNNQINLYEFSFLGHKLKLKFEFSQNFEL